jgi:hypothetical protein|tara:strand:- start:102 stop:305 length:204 start_codon:yes stop_codon:yes gene_type:complete
MAGLLFLMLMVMRPIAWRPFFPLEIPIISCAVIFVIELVGGIFCNSYVLKFLAQVVGASGTFQLAKI